MMDSMGREIDYLRLSVTDRCNLRCVYCMQESGIPLVPHDEVLSVDETVNLAGIVMRAAGIRKVRITGGEPLVRKGLEDIVRGVSKLLHDELVLTTNGVLLKGMVAILREAGISRVNISLDSLRDDRLSLISRRNLSLIDIEDSIAAAIDAGLVPVKVNCVVMKGFNDDEIPQFIEWSSRTGVTVRFIEHMPSILPQETFISRDEIIEKASVLGEIVKAGDEGTSGIYSIMDRDSSFGIIAPFSDPMCRTCSRVRLSARGRLFSCLAEEQGVSLLELLRDGSREKEIARIVRETVFNKPDSHGGCVHARMWMIGG